MGRKPRAKRAGRRPRAKRAGRKLRAKCVGLGGAEDRKEALEGDQKLDEFLFVRKEKDRSCPALSRFKSDGPGK